MKEEEEHQVTREQAKWPYSFDLAGYLDDANEDTLAELDMLHEFGY